MHYFFDYKRRSIRLKNYNYQRSSHYFITICTKNRECLFGDIVEDKMVLNKWGNIIKKYWHEIPQHFSGVKLDRFVVMPNHIHAIVVVDRWDSAVGALHCNALPRDFANQNNQKCVETNIHVDDCVKNVIVDKRALQCNAPTAESKIQANGFANLFPKGQSLSVIIRSFKAVCSKSIRSLNGPYYVWQRNYYEHIIRDEDDYNRIREYICENPLKWQSDENYRNE